MQTELEKYGEAISDQLAPLLRELAVIPAPSGQEGRRADFCERYLAQWGATPVTRDGAGNVIWKLKGHSDKWIVLCAHMDTVFGEEVPLTINERGERWYCPGIGDDTASLVVLLSAVRCLVQTGCKAGDYGLLIAGNTQEETGGAGARCLVDDLGPANIHRFYSFDGTYKNLYPGVVNYRRYIITVRAPGGHALGAYGTPNAISVLAQALCELQTYCEAMIAEKGLDRTTFNVEFFQGGEREVIIAPFATAQIEFRSDEKRHCDEMERMMERILEASRTPEVWVETQPCGIDPMWSTVPDTVMKPLEAEQIALMQSVGISPRVTKSATDCRYPMSLGIPSLCFGLCEAGAPHSQNDEWMAPGSLPLGLKLLLRLLGGFVRPAQAPVPAILT